MNKVVFAVSAVLAIAAMAVISNLRPYANEFLACFCLAVFVVALLPWLVLTRRKLFKKQLAASRGWSRAITALLLIALLLGPLVTATYLVWLKVAKPTDDWGGFVGALVVTYVSHCIGFAMCIIAFLVQLWRDQWKKVLNSFAIAYQLMVFLVLCKING